MPVGRARTTKPRRSRPDRRRPSLPESGGRRGDDGCGKGKTLDAGYRHVDTDHYYGNEAEVGEGVARADAGYEGLFPATKVHPETLGLDYDGVIEGAERSCERLGVDSLDLLYVHWPVDDYDAAETDEVRATLEVPVAAHQVEMHPLLPQEDLLADAREHDH